MIKQEFYKFIFLFAIIAVSSSALVGCGGSKTAINVNTSDAAPSQAVQTTTAQAIVRDMPTYFEATGSLASDAQTDVAPTVGGKIIEVNFDIGSYVERGGVLVRLDDRDAQIRLQQAQAAVAQQEEAVRAAQANVQQAEANVRQTQARLGLTSGSAFDIETFSQVRATRAQLELAEKELSRAERLLESGDIARTIYDQRLAQRNQLRAQLDEARSTASVAVSAIRTAQAGVGTAQAQVANARAAVEAGRTQIEQARKAIADTIVYAPLSGYIAERNADVGEFATTSQKVATIVRTGVLRLRIDVPEQSIGNIAVGQGVSAQVSAYPDRSFAGRVVRVAPSLNATSRTLIVEAEIENVGGLLKPGQFATVRITQPQTAKVVMIPAAAVRTDGTTNSVFVIKDGRAEQRQVQIGQLENDLIEIKQGVAPDETVATTNLPQLGDGVFVSQ